MRRDHSPCAGAAFAVTFVGSVAMWAVYLNVGAERASRQIAHSRDPGRLGRSGYTYSAHADRGWHSAVADELMLSRPLRQIDLKNLLVIIGAPALYPLGTAFLKSLTAPNLPLSHLIGARPAGTGSLGRHDRLAARFVGWNYSWVGGGRDLGMGIVATLVTGLSLVALKPEQIHASP